MTQRIDAPAGSAAAATSSPASAASPAASPASAIGEGPPSTARRDRLVGPDVVRAVALIGVVIMNYHGYLNGGGAVAGPDATWAQSLFDPWNGVLGTRFAATFVTVAGVGITLLTRRSVASGDREAIREDRWRLVRRGVLLYLVGLVLDWIWAGTILFYYGAFFVLAALLFTLRSRTLLVLGALAAVGAAAIQWWAVVRHQDGHDVSWLLSPDALGSRSPRGLLFDTFVNGTHPVLPWLLFLTIGMVIGRHLGTLRRLPLALAAGAVTAATYAVNHLVWEGSDDPVLRQVLSTRHLDRGLLYSLGTAGTSVVAFCVISWVAERFERTPLVEALAAAGRTTLSLYVLHVLVFRGLVDGMGAVGPTGLDTALVFATTFWVFAIVVAAWWQRFAGQGPLERTYRAFGG